LGTQCSKTGDNGLSPDAETSSNTSNNPEFDLDSYKILVKPIMLGSVRVELQALREHF
jgi:hypothetical protein